MTADGRPSAARTALAGTARRERSSPRPQGVHMNYMRDNLDTSIAQYALHHGRVCCGHDDRRLTRPDTPHAPEHRRARVPIATSRASACASSTMPSWRGWRPRTSPSRRFTPGSSRLAVSRAAAYPAYRAALDREEAAARDLHRLSELTAPCLALLDARDRADRRVAARRRRGVGTHRRSQRPSAASFAEHDQRRPAPRGPPFLGIGAPRGEAQPPAARRARATSNSTAMSSSLRPA